MKKYVFLLSSLMLAVSFQTAEAAGLKGGGGMYVGGGLGINSLSGFDDAIGFQFFGGYNVGELAPNMNLDVEVGYMDSGDFETTAPQFCVGTFCVGGGTITTSANGLWGTAVFRYAANPQFDLLGRAGWDFGDDDGFMFGVGAGYNLNKQGQVRLEYVVRDNIDSIQLNYRHNLH